VRSPADGADDASDSNSFNDLEGVSPALNERGSKKRAIQDEGDETSCSNNFNQYVVAIRDCSRRSLQLLNEIRSLEHVDDLPLLVRRSRELASWYNEVVLLAEQSLGDYDEIPENLYSTFVNENVIASNAISAIESDLDLALHNAKESFPAQRAPVIPPAGGSGRPQGRKYVSIDIPSASPPRFSLSPSSRDDFARRVRRLTAGGLTTDKAPKPLEVPVPTFSKAPKPLEVPVPTFSPSIAVGEGLGSSVKGSNSFGSGGGAAKCPLP
jgi:hypothetical protein